MIKCAKNKNTNTQKNCLGVREGMHCAIWIN